MNNRAKCISESIITIAFQAVMTIIFLRESIFMKTKPSEENGVIYSIASSSITLLTIFSSTIGIILWMNAAEIITINIIQRLLPSIPILVHVSGVLMILTSFLLFLLFKQNQNPGPATLGTLFLFILGSLIIYLLVQNIRINQNGNNYPIPIDYETELQQLIELAAGVTNLFFVGLIARVIDYFQTTGQVTNEDNNPMRYNFDWSLFFIFLGSLCGVLIMVLISAVRPRPNRNNTNIIMGYNFALVFVVMVNVIIGTYKLLEIYALLEVIVPSLVVVFVWLCMVFFHHEHPRDLEDTRIGPHAEVNVNAKPISLSFTNIAFTGLLAAVGWSVGNKDGRNHMVFAFFASSGLVSALIWRVVTHDSLRKRIHVMVENVISVFTLLLLFLTVVASAFIVWD